MTNTQDVHHRHKICKNIKLMHNWTMLWLCIALSHKCTHIYIYDWFIYWLMELKIPVHAHTCMHLTQVSTICILQRHSFVVKCRNTWKSTHPLFWRSCKVLQPWMLFCVTMVYVEIFAVGEFSCTLWVILHLWDYKRHKVDHPWVCYVLVCSVCTTLSYANCKN